MIHYSVIATRIATTTLNKFITVLLIDLLNISLSLLSLLFHYHYSLHSFFIIDWIILIILILMLINWIIPIIINCITIFIICILSIVITKLIYQYHHKITLYNNHFIIHHSQCYTDNAYFFNLLPSYHLSLYILLVVLDFQDQIV